MRDRRLYLAEIELVLREHLVRVKHRVKILYRAYVLLKRYVFLCRTCKQHLYSRHKRGYLAILAVCGAAERAIACYLSDEHGGVFLYVDYSAERSCGVVGCEGCDSAFVKRNIIFKLLYVCFECGIVYSLIKNIKRPFVIHLISP